MAEAPASRTPVRNARGAPTPRVRSMRSVHALPSARAPPRPGGGAPVLHGSSLAQVLTRGPRRVPVAARPQSAAAAYGRRNVAGTPSAPQPQYGRETRVLRRFFFAGSDAERGDRYPVISHYDVLMEMDERIDSTLDHLRYRYVDFLTLPVAASIISMVQVGSKPRYPLYNPGCSCRPLGACLQTRGLEAHWAQLQQSMENLVWSRCVFSLSSISLLESWLGLRKLSRDYGDNRARRRRTWT